MIDWPNFAIIVVALLVNVPSWIMLREAKRKTGSESDKILAEAEKELAEARLLEAQYNTGSIERRDKEIVLLHQRISDLTKRMDEQERAFKIVISFARTHYEGSKILAAQVKRYEEPQFIPAEKFPTGPLGAV